MNPSELSLPAAPARTDTPPEAPSPVHTPAASRASRWGLWALLIGLGGFFAWAALAPLDEGVPAHGMVAVDTKRKTVQHLSGGLVRDVLVREGQRVQEGQVLFRLDDRNARAQFESVRQRYLGLRAMQSRLQAEQSGATGLNWHPDLLKEQDDPLIRAQMTAQQQLWQARRDSLRAQLQAIDEAIRGQQATLQALHDMLPQRQRQLALLQEDLRNITALAAEGYAPRVRQNELQRAVSELQANITELDGNIRRAQSTIAELRQRAQTLLHDQRKAVEAELTQVNLEVQAEEARLRAVAAELERTTIVANATGHVVGLAVQAVGAVIQPGQKLLDIVPEGEPLLLEARLEPHLIDRVHSGLKTDVRFAAFAHTPMLVVEGEVTSVSKDLLTDPQTGVPYYLLRVALTPHGMQQLGARQLQPGMPAEIIVKTGERSLLTYLLSPLTRRVASSLKEE